MSEQSDLVTANEAAVILGLNSVHSFNNLKRSYKINPAGRQLSKNHKYQYLFLRSEVEAMREKRALRNKDDEGVLQRVTSRPEKSDPIVRLHLSFNLSRVMS